MHIDRKCCIKFIITILFAIVNVKRCIAEECDEFDWQCLDGKCIDSIYVCDGTQNCKDGSDETAASCISTTCPGFTFRCSYGACIPNKRKCDGAADCIDGSDESVMLCGTDAEKENFLDKYVGECRDEGMQCLETKECIDDRLQCDGIRHCADGSDETAELCSHIECPSYSFKCGYGACVSGKAACNNITDCADRSDESYVLCGYKAVTTSTTTAKPPQVSDGRCYLPQRRYLVVRNQADGRIIESPLRNGAAVRYECTFDTFLMPEVHFGFCNGGTMSGKVPQCIKKCNTIDVTTDFSTNAKCDFNGEPYQCSDIPFVRPGTRASFTCNTYFKNDIILPVRHCLDDGFWDKHPPTCDMLCGGTVNTTQLSKDAIFAYKPEVPWHVTIFSNTRETVYDYKCGGTIISPILVLTAAHCAYDPTTKKADNPDFYLIIPTINKSIYSLTETDILVRHVSSILIPSQYNHDSWVADLAMFVLRKHLIFSTKLRPICLQFYEFSGKEVISNVEGKLGALDSNVADMALTIITGKQFSYIDCKKTSVAKTIIGDKFCVKLTFGRACRGDSGGGFYVQQGDLYYLSGVLSNAALQEDGCSREYVMLTNIQHYSNWIMDNKNNEERKYKYGI